MTKLERHLFRERLQSARDYLAFLREMIFVTAPIVERQEEYIRWLETKLIKECKPND